MRRSAVRAPTGSCTGWGIPFQIGRPLLVTDAPHTLEIEALRARWLVFLHTTDLVAPETNEHGFIRPTRGGGRLGEHVADYVLVYADGSEARHAIRRRHEVGMLWRRWGESCFEAVTMRKPHPIPAAHEQASRWSRAWGATQTRAANRDRIAAW